MEDAAAEARAAAQTELVPISEAAKQVGVPASTLRYYNDRGLVASVARRGGRRMYDRRGLRRIAFIRMAQRFDIGLDRIEALFGGGGPSWRTVIGRQIDALAEKEAEARSARTLLEHAQDCPHEIPWDQCPYLLDTLDRWLAAGGDLVFPEDVEDESAEVYAPPSTRGSSTPSPGGPSPTTSTGTIEQESRYQDKRGGAVDMLIREATRADLPAIMALIAADAIREVAEDVGGTGDEPAPAYVAAYEAIESDPNTMLVVGELDDEVVATAHLYFLRHLTYHGGSTAQVESVRTAAGLRGQGIGTALMEWVIAEARRRGAVRVQLTSNQQRQRAHEFYRRLGFAGSHLGMKRYLGTEGTDSVEGAEGMEGTEGVEEAVA